MICVCVRSLVRATVAISRDGNCYYRAILLLLLRPLLSTAVIGSQSARRGSGSQGSLQEVGGFGVLGGFEDFGIGWRLFSVLFSLVHCCRVCVLALICAVFLSNCVCVFG